MPRERIFKDLEASNTDTREDRRFYAAFSPNPTGDLTPLEVELAFADSQFRGLPFWN